MTCVGVSHNGVYIFIHFVPELLGNAVRDQAVQFLILLLRKKDNELFCKNASFTL
jgi:hypothetical protein